LTEYLEKSTGPQRLHSRQEFQSGGVVAVVVEAVFAKLWNNLFLLIGVTCNTAIGDAW
jgi:hypothetical protein